MNLEQAKKQNLDVFTFAKTAENLRQLVTDLLTGEGRQVELFEEEVSGFTLLCVSASRPKPTGSAVMVKAQKEKNKVTI